MDSAHSLTTPIDETVPGTAKELPASMSKACHKLAISMEQVKLLENCMKLKMGTRGVEILISKIIWDDICSVGEEISEEIGDVEVYDAMMGRKIKTAEKKLRKWKTIFHKEKRRLQTIYGPNNRKYRRLIRIANEVKTDLSSRIYTKNQEKIAHLKLKFAREIEARKLVGRRVERERKSRLPTEIIDYRDLDVFSDTESGYESDYKDDDDVWSDGEGDSDDDEDVCRDCKGKSADDVEGIVAAPPIVMDKVRSPPLISTMGYCPPAKMGNDDASTTPHTSKMRFCPPAEVRLDDEHSRSEIDKLSYCPPPKIETENRICTPTQSVDVSNCPPAPLCENVISTTPANSKMSNCPPALNDFNPLACDGVKFGLCPPLMLQLVATNFPNSSL